MTEKEEFEKVYIKPGAIWTMEEPPEILQDLIKKRIIEPSKVLDIGCGEGLYAIYLAKQGFDVTAIDFSERAIEYARQNAKNTENIKFLAMDVKDINKLGKLFDFAFEWGLLHHLTEAELKSYVSKIPKVLKRGALYLSASFNTQSAVYGNPGQRYRETPIGTKLYYRSQEELRKLFESNFTIEKEEIIQLIGKGVSQPGNLFLMRKK